MNKKLLTLLTVLLIARGSFGADRFWDVSGTAGNGVGGSGTWASQVEARFSTTSAGTALTSAATTDDGKFQGTAGTITLGFSPTLASWTFATTNYTLTSGTTDARTLTGSFTLANNVNLNIGNNETTDRFLTLAGAFSGGSGASLTIQAGATGTALTRLGLNSTGINVNVPITVSGTGFGAISSASSATVSGTVTGNGTRLNLGSTNATGLTFTNTINNGAGAVRIAAGSSGGAGRVTISSTGNTWGDTELNNTNTGILRLGVTDALPTGTTLRFGATAGVGNSIFDLSGFNQTIGQLTNGAQSGGTIRMTTSVGGATSKLTISGADTAQPAYSGIIENGVGTVSLERAGMGTTTLTGVNTYTGGTTVSGGTLALGNATDTLANTGVVLVSGGILSIGANSDTVGAVTLSSGSITGTSGTLTGSSYGVQSGTISAKIGGAGALTKTTAGTVILTSNSVSTAFTGTTTISAGTLQVDGSIANSAVTVSGGTLSGSGTVGSVNVTSGTLAPGTSPGILNTNGNLSLALGSTYLVDINGAAVAGTDYDQTNVIGGVSLGDATLTLNTSYTPMFGDSIIIINNDGGDSVSGMFDGLAEGSMIAGWTISYMGGDGNDVTLSAAVIPEPSTWVVGALVFASLLVSQRRRLKAALAVAKR